MSCRMERPELSEPGEGERRDQGWRARRLRVARRLAQGASRVTQGARRLGDAWRLAEA
jgi:hypothetical protein